jgi:hypothetical protein
MFSRLIAGPCAGCRINVIVLLAGIIQRALLGHVGGLRVRVALQPVMMTGS